MIAAEPPSREELGQYLTQAPIARFLASLFTFPEEEVRLLDPGAGTGALTTAVAERLCGSSRPPKRIAVTGVEVDPRMWEPLAETHASCGGICEKSAIDWEAAIVRDSFFDFALSYVREDFFTSAAAPFNAAILNPPYRKIHSDSVERQQLRAAGLETSNLYTGFLFLAARILAPGGELVAIVPRSFCNGPYFRVFREQFFAMMSLRRIHLFESRTAAFREDAVLQENIVFYAVKTSKAPKEVVVSSSHGEPSAGDPVARHPYSTIFAPGDPQRFLHIPAAGKSSDARALLGRVSCTLSTLGLEVSTGRVVDFRARSLLCAESGPNTFPLIYPCHCRGGRVVWPGSQTRKPNAIAAAADAQNLLVPAETYVLTKRFTSKEERRRIVASIFEPSVVASDRVGFENHLNYFHSRGRGLPRNLAFGLAVYLNSTVVDQYFRQFNGHTQVNATDLRNLPYPSHEALTRLGVNLGNAVLAQDEIDHLVTEHLL